MSRPITRVMLDHSVTFQFSNLDGPDAELKLETPFDMRKPDGSAARIDPAVKGRDYSAAIDLFECVIVDVAIDDASTLTITFNNGDVLSAPKDGNYESWSYVDDVGGRVICLPSGGLAIWSALE